MPARAVEGDEDAGSGSGAAAGIDATLHGEEKTKPPEQKWRALFYPTVPWGAEETYEKGYMRGEGVLLAWEGLVCLLAFYTLVRTPYHFAFAATDYDPGDCVALEFRHEGRLQQGLAATSLLQDVVYVVDIGVQLLSAVFVNRWGRMLSLVDDLPSIRRHYLSGLDPTNKSFAWDVLAAIAWRRIGCAAFAPPVTSDASGRGLAASLTFLVLDLLRTTKVLRCKEVQLWWKGMTRAGAFLKLFAQLFLTSHFVGCLWFRAAASGWFSRDLDPEDNWLTANDMLPRTPDNWPFEYVTAVYWVITTMSTVGYGDLLPSTTFERTYTMLVMIGGVTFFAGITGTITEIISNASRGAQRFQEFMGEVIEFIKVAQVPEEQEKLMLQFFELKYPDQNIFNDAEIIDMLPSGLRRKILTATYQDHVTQVYECVCVCVCVCLCVLCEIKIQI